MYRKKKLLILATVCVVSTLNGCTAVPESDLAPAESSELPLALTESCEENPEPEFLAMDQDVLEKAQYGSDYDTIIEYETAAELTEELYQKMKACGYEWYDFDGDGLTDYEEMEVYHSDPNAKSTSGDLYSDSYKVSYGMDMNQSYEMDWIALDSLVSVFSEVTVYPEMKYSGVYYDYLEMPGVMMLDMGAYLKGTVRLTLDHVQDVSALTVESYVLPELVHTPVAFETADDSISFYVGQGEEKFLIYPKGTDLDAVLNTHK